MSLVVFILELWFASGAPLLLLPGEQWRDDLPSKKLPRDYAVVCSDQLMAGRMRIRKAQTEIAETDDYIKISVDQCVNPSFLVRGIAGLKPGKIEAARIVDVRKLEWKGRTLELPDGPAARLVDGGRSQVLVPKVEFSHLVWGGDLDGDGELDLIIQVKDGEYTGRYILFTTRGRKPGELVRPAASVHHDDHC